MLDIRRIKENPEEIIDLLTRKGEDARETIERILELDNLIDNQYKFVHKNMSHMYAHHMLI